MAEHGHIQAFLMYEIEKLLEAIQKRGVGYIDGTYGNMQTARPLRPCWMISSAEPSNRRLIICNYR